MPYADWATVSAWVSTLPDHATQSAAWTAAEKAWLLHLRASLGDRYRLAETSQAFLVSPLETGKERAALDFMSRTPARIVQSLAGIAQLPEYGKDILVAFENEETYYNYRVAYFPAEGEFATSSGMYINNGCGHFVTAAAELWALEPVIAHEMTHACVAHLPLPLWLNEGLAVNTERRLARANPSLYTPMEMHERHRAFWNASSIQTFWSGESFQIPGDSNELSYDLARIMIEQMARDWDSFRALALAAHFADGGAQAARAIAGIDLGSYVGALLEQPATDGWTPNPAKWSSTQNIPSSR
jgi:hypothetical protein